MAIELSIVQQRGTVFIPIFLGYSPENVSKYSGIFPGAKPAPVPVPSPFGAPMQPENLQQGGIWQLVRGGTRIVFLPNRVDIFKDWISPRHNNEEKDFLSICSAFFGELLTMEGITASRVAYSPAFARDNDSSFSEDIVWAHLLAKPSFEGINPQEVTIARNFRVTKQLEGEEYVFNFRTSFGSANHTLPDGTISTGSVLVNFDINSDQRADYAFTPETLRSFFDASLSYSDSLFKFFLED